MFVKPFEDEKHNMHGKPIKPNTHSKTLCSTHMEKSGQYSTGFVMQDRTAFEKTFCL